MTSGNTPSSTSTSTSTSIPATPIHYSEEAAEMASLKQHLGNPKQAELRFEGGHFKAGPKSRKKAWALRTVRPLAQVIPKLGHKVDSALKNIIRENERQTKAAVDHLEEMASFAGSDKKLATRSFCTVHDAVNYLRETYSDYAPPETWHFPTYADPDSPTLSFLNKASWKGKKAEFIKQIHTNLKLAYRMVKDETDVNAKLEKERAAARNEKPSVKDYYVSHNQKFKELAKEKYPTTKTDSGNTPLAQWEKKEEEIYDRSVDFQTLPGHQKSGLAHSEGRRNGMEDADLHTTFQVRTQQGTVDIDISGVFDGHGGAGASRHAREQLVFHLKKRLEQDNPKSLSNTQIWNALKLAFVDTSNTYAGTGDGTTANVALMINGNLWVANLGDTRAIMVKPDGSTEQLSEDANPNDEKFSRGVEKRGSKVKGGRVGGMFGVAVARAMGDHGFHGAINARPKITMYSEPQGGWAEHTLVQCCDGVFDVATTEDVGSFVHERKDAGDSSAVIAGRLVELAYNSGSGDNLTAMVTPLGQ